MTSIILASIGVFLSIIILIVIILLVAKTYLSPSGTVKLTINGKDTLEVEQGGTLLSTLANNDIYLPQHVAVRVLAVSVRYKYLKAAVKFSILKRVSSHASR